MTSMPLHPALLRPLLLGQGMSNTQIITIVVGFGILILMLIVFAVFVRYFRLWIQSVTTRARVSIFDLLGMTFRKVNPTVIVRIKIMAV